MLLTILAWIYISVLSWFWGRMVLNFFRNDGSSPQPIHFSIYCFTGLAALGSVLMIISIFLPLGTLPVQLFLWIPALAVLFTDKDLKSSWKIYFDDLRAMNSLLRLMVTGFLVLVLVMSAWFIIHPDTLGYHAQTIQWIEKYKAIPGLANLNPRLGYQGAWYVLSAAFSFSFLDLPSLTFINTTVLLWFVLFFGSRVNELVSNKFFITAVFWLLFFIYSLWDFNQVRLTAVSAGNDFIAALYAWAAVYFFINSKKDPIYRYTTLIFAFFAVALKFSLAPVLLLTIPIILQLSQQKKNLLIVPLLAVLLLLPIVTRNIITSGYPIYPSAIGGVNAANWKMEKDVVKNEGLYIQAWARSPGVQHDQAKEVLGKGIKGWLPFWWQARPVAEKFMAVLLVIALIVSLINFKKVINRKDVYLYFVLYTGILFWWINAPDMRFGLGFILPFVAITFLPYARIKLENLKAKKLYVVITTGLILVLLGYTSYRTMHFFKWQQALLPLGIENKPFQTIQCKEIEFTLPFQGNCRDFKVPCLYSNCGNIRPRGKKIQEGFLPPAQ